MFKRLVIYIVLLLPLTHFSQDFSDLWKGHFSFNEIIDITQGNNKIFAASENAIFSLDTQTNEITELTTINGLSGQSISTILYSEIFELLVIGYENGLIEIAFDNDPEILTVVDIIDKVTIQSTNKRINHFNAFENIIYISSNFGISVFDLERLEFGDTYFIGNAGSQISVAQTTVFNNSIYAACLEGNGIRKGDVTDPNLINFQNWETVTSGSWTLIETQEDKLYAVNENRKIFQGINDVFNEVFTYTNLPRSLSAINNNLIVSTQNNVFVYDSDFNIISQINVEPSFDTDYTVATIDSENIYIGTKDFGILKTPLNGAVLFEEIHPDGPILNTPFSIEAENNGLWVTFGEYDLFYNPFPLNNRGFSHLSEDDWLNTPYNAMFDAKCLNEIAVNPFNDSQVFLSSFHSGLLEINDEVPTILYNTTNSGLESLINSNPNTLDIRVGSSLFDENGLLWTITSRVDKPLKSYNTSNGQWVSYDFTSVVVDGNLGYGDMIIGDDQTKWIASYNNGFIGFNENGGNPKLKKIFSEQDNMPTDWATALALDNNNQLWIGTFRGLRVLNNTANFFEEESVRVDEIIIEEDGIAKELLFQQFITDIEVDGSNNKWIGTADAGIFYFSPDGQNTIFHFTIDNSPLPSNVINDISIDNANGIVYIATSKGLVSFESGSSSPLEGLQSAFAYPNPVRPTFDIVEKKVKIKDVSENVNIKITDIEGNLVAEAQSRTNQRFRGFNLEIDGGTAYWNGKNLANNIVASGVYLVMLSDLDSFETKVLKLMVVR